MLITLTCYFNFFIVLPQNKIKYLVLNHKKRIKIKSVTSFCAQDSIFVILQISFKILSLEQLYKKMSKVQIYMKALFARI
jgi:hypothetical protein